MLAFLLDRRPVAYCTLWLQYLIRNTAALFTKIRVLVFRATVGAFAYYITVRQKLVVKSAVKLNNILVVDMPVLAQFFEDVLDELDIFLRACLVEKVK